MTDAVQVAAHLREFMSALPATARPLHEKALDLFLQREQNYLSMLSRDAHLSEERFLNFLECPSTYDMVMEALNEDAPANAVGTGNIAGCGVGPKGEPGFRPRKKRIDEDSFYAGHASAPNPHFYCVKCGKDLWDSRRRRNNPNAAPEVNVGQDGKTYCRKCDPLLGEEVKPKEQFAGADVFEVDTAHVMASRFGKNRYHRYSRYVGEDEVGEAIRQHGRMTKRDIVLKDQTGTMVYLRRKGLPQM